MDSSAIDQAMVKAIALAAAEHPHPNPRVGAVILAADGAELGSGAHVAPGTPHAERLAMSDAGDADHATLVVTLEPCNHTGRTPPCTDAIIAAGIARVVIGALDPDSKVDGAGVERLRSAGVEVQILDPDSELGRAAIDLDPGYFHHRRHGRPQVILKLAATLDGQVAAADGSSRWITGPALRQRVHTWRSRCDAVLIGAGTVIADDPRLDVRLDGYSGPQPRPIIVAGSRPLPRTAVIWERDPLVFTSAPIDIPSGELELVDGVDGQADLGSVLRRVGELGMLRVFVEGGPGIAASLMSSGLVDIGLLHLGAKFGLGVGRPLFDGVFATMAAATDVHLLAAELMDGDIEIRWESARQ
jgi:diaminohydroxyphosphoribosylaminopyrimidine deaminase/5-amino-6-(5-phosphoribosylamino)uracil reductase